MYNDFENSPNTSENPMGNQGPANNISPNPTTAADNGAGESTYRMKFNNGEKSEYTSAYGSGYGSGYGGAGMGGYKSGSQSFENGAGQNPGGYSHNNEYSYYSAGNEPQRTKRRKKKKGGTGRQLAKVVGFGLVFGLVAGGTMWGVNTLGNMASGKDNVQTAQDGGNTDFSLNVVKTSSENVETFEGNGVSDIVEQAKPSIVSVSTKVETISKDYFGRTYSQEGAGAGSGIIFSEENGTLYIATNYHVIKDSVEVVITFNDGSTAEATVKGFDEDEDIAVLMVDMDQLEAETKDAIRIAVLGDSDAVREGDGAIAIGNALGYGQSTTSGIISAVNRKVQLTDGTMTLIQTDAAINPGNSGGALLNARGEVIGINTVKYSETSVEGMGYAIPINQAVETISDIISGKIVNKTAENTAALGILGGTITEEATQAYGWPAGIMVSNVLDNSAAQRAGIQPGYVIVGFNGEEITTMEELQELLEDCNPGDKVTIDVVIPDAEGVYEETHTLTTLLGSAAEMSEY